MKKTTKRFIKMGFTFIILGAILSTIGAASLSYYDRGNNDLINVEGTYENIHSLDISSLYGTVNIVYGDTFSLTSTENIHSSVQDGTWKIYPKKKVISWMDTTNISWFNYKNSPETIITLPENFHADSTKIQFHAGKLMIDGINSKNFTLEVGAGYANIQSLSSITSSITVGAGKIAISNLNTDTVHIECGMGQVTVDDGMISKNSTIECGMGDTTMKLRGNAEDYGYNVDVGMGNVVIRNNGDVYLEKFTAASSKINNDKPKSFVIDCGLGNINISFMKEE